ncbi:hypothetical protein D0B54_18725 [Solimonas sp. K1W22B-7]|uniref:hypothetical protein n=1 Tax=Solimonas sp. K1W22B-7 TaxID=2303331 RepID=UPI000E32FC8A|nr:hypothetical protein [Solimonas sp. K1W22B-7]AXQ30592.1 hypothetical protein D0B54_18725 [Solimonas sp. K1W22B-7]
MGGEVSAVLEPRPGAGLAPQELRQFRASRLAPCKIPKQIEIRDEALPRIASGKIDRLALCQASTGAAT